MQRATNELIESGQRVRVPRNQRRDFASAGALMLAALLGVLVGATGLLTLIDEIRASQAHGVARAVLLESRELPAATLRRAADELLSVRSGLNRPGDESRDGLYLATNAAIVYQQSGNASAARQSGVAAMEAAKQLIALRPADAVNWYMLAELEFAINGYSPLVAAALREAYRLGPLEYELLKQRTGFGLVIMPRLPAELAAQVRKDIQLLGFPFHTPSLSALVVASRRSGVAGLAIIRHELGASNQRPGDYFEYLLRVDAAASRQRLQNNPQNRQK